MVDTLRCRICESEYPAVASGKEPEFRDPRLSRICVLTPVALH